MAITPTGDGTAVQTIHKEVHKVVVTDEYGNPQGTAATALGVTLLDKDGNPIESEEYTTDEYSLKAHLTNATIEQTTGDDHNDLSIASGWKDTSDDVRPPLVDTDGHPQVDVVGALPAGTNALGTIIQSNVLIPDDYDYISLSYTGDNLTGVVFKTGGAGGSTVGTLTLAYTGSVLDTVTKT